MLAAGLIALSITMLSGPATVGADESKRQAEPAADDQKIHITADMLTSDNDRRYAEFSGNVTARQGKTVITADSLKIFYRQSSGQQNSTGVNEASIEKIVATGRVQIAFDDKTAVTQQAVYTVDTRVLVLSGANSKIMSGKDSISGEKITFYRTDGRIKVERGSRKQVEAVVFSGSKGIQ